MLVHLLPLFLANVLSVRIAVIGLIEGIAETTASLTKIYSGWLSDRLGRRKGLTVGGYGLAALAMPLLLVARTWPVVLLYRFLDRIGKGIRTAPRDALIADSVEPRQHGVSFGIHRAADSAGAFLGLLLAIGFVWKLQGGGVALDASTFRTIVTWALVRLQAAPTPINKKNATRVPIVQMTLVTRSMICKTMSFIPSPGLLGPLVLVRNRGE